MEKMYKAKKEQKKSLQNSRQSNKNIKNKKHNNSGITLVALVITTIVLLILAGIVVKLSIGENGIITRAKDAANKYNTAQDDEIAMFNELANEYDKIVSGNWGGGTNDPSNPGTNNVNPNPGGEEPDTPTPGPGTGNLTEEEKNTLTSNGIKELDKSEISNENLKDNESIKGVITGEVPIPTGTEYKEGTKETGVVVTDGTNEFVWVPVPDINEMAVLQSGSSTDYQGVLYDFLGTTATKKDIVAIGGTTGYREPDVLTNANYGDTASRLSQINNILGTEYASNNQTAISQFKQDLQNDFNKMVESVKKYKGFFVGRYETSINIETKRAYSQKGVIPATAATSSANRWWGLYAYQKNMAKANGYTSLESHMIWGCNYDALLRWGLTGADASKVTEIGNAAHDLSSLYETGKNTIAGKEDRINNVYDLEGNGVEWTAEALNTNVRSGRGGYYGNGSTPSLRNYNYYATLNGAGICSRVALYIK